MGYKPVIETRSSATAERPRDALS